MAVATGLFHRRNWSESAVTIVLLLSAAVIGEGAAPAQATSMGRRIQTDIDLLSNTRTSAEDGSRAQADLLAAIRTPGGQERFVVMFEDASFAIHAGNWLQSAKPANSEDRTNICEVALGVLHNTTDSQLILAM